MTEEQKRVYSMIKDYFVELGPGKTERIAAALEACWADRERAVEAMHQVSMDAEDGGVGMTVDHALREMGEKTPWD